MFCDKLMEMQVVSRALLCCHLLEAALAHETYSGSYRLLDPLLRYIKYIDSVFGSKDGKKKGYVFEYAVFVDLLIIYL